MKNRYHTSACNLFFRWRRQFVGTLTHIVLLFILLIVTYFIPSTPLSEDSVFAHLIQNTHVVHSYSLTHSLSVSFVTSIYVVLSLSSHQTFSMVYICVMAHSTSVWIHICQFHHRKTKEPIQIALSFIHCVIRHLSFVLFLQTKTDLCACAMN